MSFQSDPKMIRWSIHLSSLPEHVYDLLSTNDGRAMFWAEAAMDLEGNIQFVFPDGQKWRGKVLEAQPGKLFKVNYVGDTTITFKLESDGQKGTVLTLTDEGVADANRSEVAAGWVSVLLALKAAADYDLDLRNHNEKYTWDKGFADN